MSDIFQYMIISFGLGGLEASVIVGLNLDPSFQKGNRQMKELLL